MDDPMPGLGEEAYEESLRIMRETLQHWKDSNGRPKEFNFNDINFARSNSTTYLQLIRGHHNWTPKDNISDVDGTNGKAMASADKEKPIIMIKYLFEQQSDVPSAAGKGSSAAPATSIRMKTQVKASLGRLSKQARLMLQDVAAARRNRKMYLRSERQMKLPQQVVEASLDTHEQAKENNARNRSVGYDGAGDVWDENKSHYEGTGDEGITAWEEQLAIYADIDQDGDMDDLSARESTTADEAGKTQQGNPMEDLAAHSLADLDLMGTNLSLFSPVAMGGMEITASAVRNGRLIYRYGGVLPSRNGYLVSLPKPPPFSRLRPRWYTASELKHIAFHLDGFHRRNSRAPGPPRRLVHWLRAGPLTKHSG